jgi:transcriptional regulator
MSQNRTAEDRAGAAAGLAASSRASDQVVATMIPK